MPSTRCGTIALAGRPNAGKSTLLNALIGEPLAIVSTKPQSTRHAVTGIRTIGNTQLLVVDPPGLLEPTYLLQHAMLAEARDVLRRADAILYLHPLDADEQPAPSLAALIPDLTLRAPVRTVYTKADLASPPTVTARRDLIVSAATGIGVDALVAWCCQAVPPGPFRCASDDASPQPLRFFVAEFVREAAFAILGEELPYALVAEVDEFREGSDPLYIRVTIYVERRSQKGMVVGKGGRTIRALGARTRTRLETFLGTRVYLDLWVTTLSRWRSTPGALRRFGFTVPSERSS